MRSAFHPHARSCAGPFMNQIHRELVNCRFQFHKRSQLFIRVHDEALSVVAVRVSNPDRSPVGINR